MPRGIDFTDDPLLQARNFSYLDTQLTRLGGPNFDQLPINRPHSPVNTTQRDGFGQQAVPRESPPTTRTHWAEGAPFPPVAKGTSTFPVRSAVTGPRVRAPSFADHYSPGDTLLEQHERTGAGAHRRRLLLRTGEVPERGDQGPRPGEPGQRGCRLTSAVAANLGKASPKGKPARGVVGSPALSIMPSAPAPVAGRVVGILAGDGVDGAGLRSLVKALSAAGAVAQVIASHGGSIAGNEWHGGVDKTAMTTQSVEYTRSWWPGAQGPPRWAPTPTPP